MATELTKRELTKHVQGTVRMKSAIFYDIKKNQQERKNLDTFLRKGSASKGIIITILEQKN